MDWLTGKSKSDQRNKNTTPLQAQRNRQIEQLKKVNRKFVWVTNTRYNVIVLLLISVYEVQRGVDYRLNLVISGIDFVMFMWESF